MKQFSVLLLLCAVLFAVSTANAQVVRSADVGASLDVPAGRAPLYEASEYKMKKDKGYKKRPMATTTTTTPA